MPQTLAALSAAFFLRQGSARGRRENISRVDRRHAEGSSAVACCLIIRTAVTILLGVSVAVRLRLLDMLEREATGYCDHPRLEGGKLGVGHLAEPFGDRIGRKVKV